MIRDPRRSSIWLISPRTDTERLLGQCPSSATTILDLVDHSTKANRQSVVKKHPIDSRVIDDPRNDWRRTKRK